MNKEKNKRHNTLLLSNLRNKFINETLCISLSTFTGEEGDI